MKNFIEITVSFLIGKNLTHFSLLNFFLILFLVAAAYSQSSTATFSGLVVDEKGGLIVGAKVTIINLATGGERSVTTNKNGSFVIPFLTPARYQIKAQREGFATAEIKEIELRVNDQIELKIQLKVGEISELVVIENSDTLIRTESAATLTVINRQLIEKLPLNGRSFLSYVALAPGVVMTKADATNQGQFSVNGQRADSNYFTVDGAGANFGANGTFTLGGTVPATNAVGGTSGLVSLDALQELSIQTSTYAPEFGRSPGAQVAAITRSGSKRFQGSLFEYFRHEALDANDWFANSRGLKKAPLRHNDFGGTIGGPLLKEKLFFFFSYEGLRMIQPKTVLSVVPSLPFRQTAPAQWQPFLNAYPLPNGFSDSFLGNFNTTYGSPRTLDATSLRLDYRLSDKLNIFGRYNYAPSWSRVRPLTLFTALSTVRETSYQTETLTLGATNTFSQTIINELRVNLSQNKSSATTTMDDFGGATPPPDSLLFPAAYASPENSSFTFSFEGTSFTKAGKLGAKQRQVNIVDTLSKISGNHHFRFGIDYRRLSPERDVFKYGQTITTNSALIVKSIASSVVITAQLGEVFPIYTNFSAYGQDMWKVTPRVTLTYGLRWELNPPPREKNGNYPYTALGGFDPAQMTLAPKGNPFWRTRFTNFAPRIGAAYLLNSEPGRETVLRGGFGVFYDLGMGNASTAMRPFGFPYGGTTTLRNVAIPLTETLAAPPQFNLNPPYQELYVFDRNMKTPRTYEWSFGVQQALGSRRSLSVSYVAAAGRELSVDQFFVRPVANPNLFRLHIVRDTGASDYRSLQVQFESRLIRNLEMLTSYTFARSTDTASNDSSFLLSTDPKLLDLDHGPSDFDVRHTLTAGLTYDVPIPGKNKLVSAFLGNWSVSSIIMTRTATPVNVTFFGNVISEIGDGCCLRPDLVPGVPIYLTDPTFPGGKRFNPLAFSSPPPDRQGTLPRNALRGFPAIQVDLSLRRVFKLTEKTELQFTAEAFNIFNHPNFANPFAALAVDSESANALNFGFSRQMLGQSLSSVGQSGLNPIYQMGTPRSFQFAMRLRF